MHCWLLLVSRQFLPCFTVGAGGKVGWIFTVFWLFSWTEEASARLPKSSNVDRTTSEVAYLLTTRAQPSRNSAKLSSWSPVWIVTSMAVSTFTSCAPPCLTSVWSTGSTATTLILASSLTGRSAFVEQVNKVVSMEGEKCVVVSLEGAERSEVSIEGSLAVGINGGWGWTSMLPVGEQSGVLSKSWGDKESTLSIPLSCSMEPRKV